MNVKQGVLFAILGLSSIASGMTFGLLDIFGFVDGRHAISFSLLGFSIVLLYVSLISIFILNISHTSRMQSIILIGTALFSVTFFFMNLNPIVTVLAALSYFLMLSYAFRSTTKRFELFVRFSPKEIFFPVLRDSFLYLLIITSLVAYSQSQRLLSQSSLITPTIAGLVLKPAVRTLNQQINAQIKSEVGDELALLPPEERQRGVALILEKTLEGMADKKTHEIYGIPTKDIPIERASIDGNGKVDLAPVFDGSLPAISHALNNKINHYALIAPLAIALLTFLIFQPLTLPLQLLESLITIGIFKLLISTGFIKVHTETKEVQRLSL